MLNISYYAGFFPTVEEDEEGSTAFYDPLWTTDPHSRSYFAEAPSYFPDYFCRVGWQVFPPAPVVPGPSGVRNRRTIWLTDSDFPGEEPTPELAQAVRKYIKRGVAKVKAAPKSKPLPQWKGRLTEVAPGIHVSAGVVDTFSPDIAFLLLDSIKRIMAGKPLAPAADKVASQLQAIVEEDDEEFLLALLLSELEIY